eukprot:4579474-Karenia_brevis.AAC.1
MFCSKDFDTSDMFKLPALRLGRNARSIKKRFFSAQRSPAEHLAAAVDWESYFAAAFFKDGEHTPPSSRLSTRCNPP